MKKRKKNKRDSFPYILISLGLVLLSTWGVHRFYYNQSIALSDSLLALYSEQKQSEIPSLISIEGLPTLSIVEAGKINNTWTVSPTAANHVRQSGNPGNPGNIIIYGHNTKKVFKNLRKVKPGETVKLTTAEGRQFTYRVISTQVVDPSQTALLSPTNAEALTIYTCYGLLDSKRLVVRAIPI